METKYFEKLELDDLGLISNEAVGSMLPGYSKTIMGRVVLAGKITTSVRTRKINDMKYYLFVIFSMITWGSLGIFVKNIHRSFSILATNKEFYTFLDTYSRQIDEYLRFF